MTFDGTWKVDRSENYENFMEAMGVNVVKRKLAAHDNLKIKIKQNGKQFSVHESSVFRTIDINFTLNETLEYSLADGTELVGDWKLNGDIMEGEFTRKDNNKVLKTTRENCGG
ncbi:fatty acid-binding protein, intestinal-like [Microcaecilia unicolor]|uniref:Fatty acid-binding protein, intestinal-like n=1 Tax=Microcaecilia unicolor TaxID=1415580 RepID=A0A6P7XBY5_9AMPH|nr:fatty acid-binding protein, intestinal-like [Microcaecilia unicolor]